LVERTSGTLRNQESICTGDRKEGSFNHQGTREFQALEISELTLQMRERKKTDVITNRFHRLSVILNPSSKYNNLEQQEQQEQREQEVQLNKDVLNKTRHRIYSLCLRTRLLATATAHDGYE